MLVALNSREENFTEVNRIIIRIGDIDYRISLDKFNNGLVVNKYSYGEESSTISISANVSNEIVLK